ncbi:MAG: hypothetical protein ACRD2G_03125 [Terriglobia bacterium]
MFGDFPGRLINFFKDLGLCGSAFLFSGAWSGARRTSGKDWVYDLGRVILAISITAFGVLHFLYPVFGPGIPPMFESVPWLIPGHLFWVYLTGAIFVAVGVSIMVNHRVRWTATWLAAVILTVPSRDVGSATGRQSGPDLRGELAKGLRHCRRDVDPGRNSKRSYNNVAD